MCSKLIKESPEKNMSLIDQVCPYTRPDTFSSYSYLDKRLKRTPFKLFMFQNNRLSTAHSQSFFLHMGFDQTQNITQKSLFAPLANLAQSSARIFSINRSILLHLTDIFESSKRWICLCLYLHHSKIHHQFTQNLIFNLKQIINFFKLQPFIAHMYHIVFSLFSSDIFKCLHQCFIKHNTKKIIQTISVIKCELKFKCK